MCSKILTSGCGTPCVGSCMSAGEGVVSARVCAGRCGGRQVDGGWSLKHEPRARVFELFKQTKSSSRTREMSVWVNGV